MFDFKKFNEENIRKMRERNQKGAFHGKGTRKGRTRAMIALELFKNLKKFVEKHPEGRNIPAIEIFQFIGKIEAKDVPHFYRGYLSRNGIHLKYIKKHAVIHVKYVDPIKELDKKEKK